MFVESGGKIYQTDFEFEDLKTFYQYGHGATVVDKINDGGMYFWKNRIQTEPKIAGSNMALVPIHIQSLVMKDSENIAIQFPSRRMLSL